MNKVLVLIAAGRILLVAALLSTVATSTQAQHFFRPMPKLSAYRPMRGITKMTVALDSVYIGMRPAVSVAVYSFPGSTLMTGAGVSYEKDTYRYDAQKWYTDWSIGILGYAGGALSPQNPSAVIAFGPNLSLMNKLVSVGAVYNLSIKQWQATVGFSIALNN